MSTVRVMISVPESLLSRIDEAADDLGKSRSALLREAAIEYMARRNRVPGDDPRVRAAHEAISALAARVRAPGGPDSVTLVRAIRDSRADRLAASKSE